MQRPGLGMFERNATVAMHNRFRQPRRARREQDVQRVIERNCLKPQWRVIGEQSIPCADTRITRELALGLKVTDVHDVLKGRKRCSDLIDMRAAVNALGAVHVAIDGNQHLRLDLCPAVGYCTHPKLGRTRTPNCTKARRCQERNQRLRDVRAERNHPIAAADAPFDEAGPTTCDLIDQLCPGDLATVTAL